MPVKAGAIILAAGLSRRMGRDKRLIEIDGTPMLLRVVAAVQAAGLPTPIVVIRPDDTDVRGALARTDVRIVEAADHALGMAHSLAAGVRAIPEDWDAAFICLGDMPRISSALLNYMEAAYMEGEIVIPVTFEGQRGNPVLWGRAHFAALGSLSGDTGGRVLLADRTAHIIEQIWHDDSILFDVDTPDDLPLG